MKLGEKTVLICDCAGSMPLDGDAIAKAFGAEGCTVSRLLCRDQIARVAQAGRGSDLIIGCTQEGAAFAEALEENGLEPGLQLVNIRERAGWSSEAKSATPKIAALLAEAALAPPDVSTVSMNSGGICLVYGAGQVALDAARQLDGRMTVSLLLTDPGDLLPLGMMDLMAATGRIASAAGPIGRLPTITGPTGSWPSPSSSDRLSSATSPIGRASRAFSARLSTTCISSV